VDQIVNIKGLNGLKDIVVGALKNINVNLADYEGKDQKFNYFGIITAYNETEISIRLITFQMNLKQTKVNLLCGGIEKTHFDSIYDTYQFVGNKTVILKMYDIIGDQILENMAKSLLDFIKAHQSKQLFNFQNRLADLFKPVST